MANVMMESNQTIYCETSFKSTFENNMFDLKFEKKIKIYFQPT
jgi:hypothetical protein